MSEKLCKGIRKDNQPCTAPAMQNEEYCWKHCAHHYVKPEVPQPPKGGSMRKTCTQCGAVFETDKKNYFLCRDCYYDGNPPKRCKATKASGEPCNAWAMQERNYCANHWHYELFAKVIA